MDKTLKTTVVILILLSLIFGFLIRLFVILHFTNFSGDQIRDAYVTMGMWKGIFPTLGPISAWGDVYLPPLYFYLVFPFTVIGPDLSSQAIPNALFTFLSIPLLIFTVYKLLENIQEAKRLFLASLAGFWYSVLFKNIVINTGDSLAGNPGSILFFFLAFILLYTYQLEGKLSLIKGICSWITYGLVLAILVSLHFTTFFVISVIFILSIVFYIYKNSPNKKLWILPILAVISALFALTPYWLGEIGRNWQNSQKIINLVLVEPSKEKYAMTVFQRLSAIANGYLDLGSQVYFIGNSWKTAVISSLFMLLVLILGIIKFKGNKIIFSQLILTWCLFLYAYSSANISNTYNPIFYKLLIYLAPLFLTIWTLAYLDFPRRVNQALVALLVVAITVSIVINLKYNYNYVTGRAGMPRIPNTFDLAQLLNEIPKKSTICTPKGDKVNIKDDEYIDRYVTHRELNFIPYCQSGYYFAYPKYESIGDYTKRRAKPFAEAYRQFDRDYVLYKDMPLFYLYRLI